MFSTQALAHADALKAELAACADTLEAMTALQQANVEYAAKQKDDAHTLSELRSQVAELEAARGRADELQLANMALTERVQSLQLATKLANERLEAYVADQSVQNEKFKARRFAKKKKKIRTSMHTHGLHVKKSEEQAKPEK